jgi:hypothetical protein
MMSGSAGMFWNSAWRAWLEQFLHYDSEIVFATKIAKVLQGLDCHAVIEKYSNCQKDTEEIPFKIKLSFLNCCDIMESRLAEKNDLKNI